MLPSAPVSNLCKGKTPILRAIRCNYPRGGGTGGCTSADGPPNSADLLHTLVRVLVPSPGDSDPQPRSLVSVARGDGGAWQSCSQGHEASEATSGRGRQAQHPRALLRRHPGHPQPLQCPQPSTAVSGLGTGGQVAGDWPGKGPGQVIKGDFKGLQINKGNPLSDRRFSSVTPRRMNY